MGEIHLAVGMHAVHRQCPEAIEKALQPDGCEVLVLPQQEEQQVFAILQTQIRLHPFTVSLQVVHEKTVLLLYEGKRRPATLCRSENPSQRLCCRRCLSEGVERAVLAS